MIEIFLSAHNNDLYKDCSNIVVEGIVNSKNPRYIAIKYFAWFKEHNVEYYYAVALKKHDDGLVKPYCMSPYYIIGGFYIYLDLQDSILFKLAFSEENFVING